MLLEIIMLAVPHCQKEKKKKKNLRDIEIIWSSDGCSDANIIIADG